MQKGLNSMNDKIKKKIDKIRIPEELDHRVKLGASLASNEKSSGKKRKNFTSFVRKKRKTAYIVGIALITCLLLFNSILHSKTVLAYISEIPIVSNIFNLEPLTELIYTELEEKDYNINYIDGVHISLFNGNKVSITMGGTENFQAAYKQKLKQTVELFLQKNDYHAFDVQIIEQTDPIIYDLTEDQQKEKERMEQEIEAMLLRSDVDYEYIEVEPLEKNIHVQVHTSTNDEAQLKEHSLFVKNNMESELEFGDYNLFVSSSGPDVMVGDNYTLRPATDLDMSITKLAVDLTENKDYQVTGFSNTDEPLTFTISTSVDSSDKEHGKFLETVIHQYFESPDVAPSLNGASYEVIIYSKDEKQIN